MSRIFLVDDHIIVRDGLRAMLTPEPDLTIVGEASNGQELLDKLPDTPTDVVLLDANMPVLDGLATTQRLQAEYPHIRILILSMLAHERYVGQFFDAGAAGYVLKSADKAEIIIGIQTVLAGRQFLCSDLGLSMLRKVLSQDVEAVEAAPVTKLSRRESEVLNLLSEGLTTSEIAERLFTSKRTIETHRQNILEKTQTKNTAALIKLAVTQGLLN